MHLIMPEHVGYLRQDTNSTGKFPLNPDYDLSIGFFDLSAKNEATRTITHMVTSNPILNPTDPWTPKKLNKSSLLT